MKKYHCCVPGCSTYGPISNFLNIPFESHWRDQWLSLIPRKNWVVDSTTVACLKHFQLQSALVPFMSSPDKNQNNKKNSTSNLKAVPQFFPKSDNKNDRVRIFIPTEMFELYCRDCEGPDVFGDIEDDDKDYVINYWYFTLMYPRRFATFLESMWKAVSTKEYTIFYTLDLTEMPRIVTSIKIDNELRVTVILDSRIMDPCDLAWVIPVTTNKVHRWSQLQIMLTMFGK